ncbi:MAG: hypothetical protein IT323_07760 [Anaerolineae bacterium]|nr:hypothetical protein [Anaerolineae bacterium]
MRAPKARPGLAACLAAALALSLVAGCASDAVPTATTLDMALTEAYLTDNAPPPGFNTPVQFAPVDKNLDALPHWHYTVSLTFTGTFEGGEATDGEIRADVYSNELVGERRVVLKASGSVFAEEARREVEGVRLGNAFYFVDQNGVCSDVTGSDNPRVAELTAGSLVGGVKLGTPTTTHRTVDEVEVWQYVFLPGDVEPPVLTLAEGGSARIASGELWIAPSLNAVKEYSITLEVSGAIIPVFQDQRPATGTLKATYRLVETMQPYNIAIPFGC